MGFFVISSGSLTQDQQDILATNEPINAILYRKSQSEIAIKKMADGLDFVVVNGKVVDVSIEKVCITKDTGSGVDNLINSTGQDYGTPPQASDFLYIYISNSQATYAPSSLRCSYTAPTNGYLGTSGNAANWRFVGVAKLSSLTNLYSRLSVCGYNYEKFTKKLTSDFIKTVGTDGWQSDLTDFFLAEIAIMPNFIVRARHKLITSNTYGSCRTRVNAYVPIGVGFDLQNFSDTEVSGSSKLMHVHFFEYEATEHNYISMRFEYYYNSGFTFTVYGDGDGTLSYMQVERIPFKCL